MTDPPDTAASPPPTPTPDAEAHACARCGRPLEAGTRFCAACGLRAGPLRLTWSRERYWRILVAGALLYALTTQALVASGNIKFLPTVLLLGSFAVPVSFVAFLYENETFSQIPLTTVALAFLLGGVLGTVAAQTLEGGVVALYPPLLVLLVGFIEEAVKLLGVVWWLRRPELNSEAHGLVLGGAAGMGFAALETMGVGLIALIQSHGNLHMMGAVLAGRALLSPLAHGTWTAILAATIWREKAAGRRIIGRPVIGSFVLVSLLHSAWDFAAGIPWLQVTLPFVQVTVPALAIGAIGLWVLHLRMVESHRPGAMLQ